MTPLWWAVAALIAPAAPAESPSLAAWHGSWSGAGEAFGKPATATLAIAPGEGGATSLVYRLSIDGTPPVRYSAEAGYSLDAEGRLHGKWSDSYGRTRPVSGGIEGPVWWTHWGSADVEIGRSTYALDTDGTLTVSDSILQPDGGWRVFAVLHYRRNKV
ncbi:hypothetical protein [Sphingopyxis macrogoltabida]|uniref:Uncharacterized protein n=1 Tax=Sphingopyxis macrogoltabida TaxID=33050 RepID=A0AAC9AYL1_SPHMC|nr:hypothetical protein [Sphingopyxis macrogoltabida]ALJ16012.1 hypothetical protein LH19_24305 [Sphingopyxis macrogoltabida]AMU92253.1 hypothetical protein ATM17_24870 [Sphingopyxis macrogoltabida]